MARIAGVDLPKEKRVEIGLTYVYGIGRTSSNKILAEAGVNPDTRVKDLTDDQVNSIRKAMEGYKVEGDLRREVALNIKRLTEIGCFRGIRHRRGLPVRGLVLFLLKHQKMKYQGMWQLSRHIPMIAYFWHLCSHSLPSALSHFLSQAFLQHS